MEGRVSDLVNENQEPDGGQHAEVRVSGETVYRGGSWKTMAGREGREGGAVVYRWYTEVIVHGGE